MVLALPVTDWLIVFSAPHQTSEISDYDKKSWEISSSLTLHLALLDADWFPELHASRASGSSQCPDGEQLRNSFPFPLPCPPHPPKMPSPSGVGMQGTCPYCQWQLPAACQGTHYLLKYEIWNILKYVHCRCCTSQFVGNPLYDTFFSWFWFWFLSQGRE